MPKQKKVSVFQVDFRDFIPRHLSDQLIRFLIRKIDKGSDVLIAVSAVVIIEWQRITGNDTDLASAGNILCNSSAFVEKYRDIISAKSQIKTNGPLRGAVFILRQIQIIPVLIFPYGQISDHIFCLLKDFSHCLGSRMYMCIYLPVVRNLNYQLGLLQAGSLRLHLLNAQL